MWEVARAFATLLILVFSGLSFWYQFVRTPRSDVGLEVISREKPYSTDSGGITFSGPAIQLYNRGDMEAIVETQEVSGELRDGETGEVFQPSGDHFEVSFRRSTLEKLSPGMTEQIKPLINIRHLDQFPADFKIHLSFRFEFRDSSDTYELSAEEGFKFENQRVQ